MNRERWNRLYRRMVSALWNLPDDQQASAQRRWLDWAEKVTGTTCFFMRWQ